LKNQFQLFLFAWRAELGVAVSIWCFRINFSFSFLPGVLSWVWLYQFGKSISGFP